jgi:hypothetical protein
VFAVRKFCTAWRSSVMLNAENQQRTIAHGSSRVLRPKAIAPIQLWSPRQLQSRHRAGHSQRHPEPEGRHFLRVVPAAICGRAAPDARFSGTAADSRHQRQRNGPGIRFRRAMDHGKADEVRQSCRARSHCCICADACVRSRCKLSQVAQCHHHGNAAGHFQNMARVARLVRRRKSCSGPFSQGWCNIAAFLEWPVLGRSRAHASWQVSRGRKSTTWCRRLIRSHLHRTQGHTVEWMWGYQQ